MELSKIKEKRSKEDSRVLAGCGSVVQHVLSMPMSLGSILRTTKPPKPTHT